MATESGMPPFTFATIVANGYSSLAKKYVPWPCSHRSDSEYGGWNRAYHPNYQTYRAS